MQIIDNTRDLIALIDKLRQGDFVTIDTEFMWERSFWPQLCLIQIANDTDEAIIDPLSKDIELTSFYELLTDATTLKVMHGCRNDILIFVNEGNVVPQPLFDTQIAAMVCGFGMNTSYEKLVNVLTDANLDKSQRNTDWSKRPLSDMQLQYALGDVTYLRDIYRRIYNELDTRGRHNWIEDEMRVLTDSTQYLCRPDDAWQRFKIGHMGRRSIGVLFEVAARRENIEQQQNVPRGRVLKDEAIREIVRHPPKTSNDFDKIRAIPHNFKKSTLADTLLIAIKKGMNTPDELLPDLPNTNDSPPGTQTYVILLNILLKYCSDCSEVATSIIASREDLLAIARNQLDNVAAMNGWRYEVFGQYALALRAGRLSLGANEQGVILIEHAKAHNDAAIELSETTQNLRH